MPNKKNIKILVSTHKPSVLLKNDFIVPIHVGRAAAQEKIQQGALSQNDYNWLANNMIGDDTGENISSLNERFCELTATYWAWKNYDRLGNPDYVGFMHYRRYFIFDENYKRKFPEFEVFPRIEGSYLEALNIDPENISRVAGDYDFLITDWVQLPPNNYEQYRKSPAHKIETIDCALEIIQKDHPRYAQVAYDYFHKMDKSLFCNMFVAKKEIFFEYCEWIFDILFKVDKQTDYTNDTVGQRRACGFLAERLTGIFFYELMLKKKKSFRLLPVAFIENPDRESDVTPAFGGSAKNINICFSTDNNYAPYLGVAIKSVIEHSSKEFNYDIFILDSNISKQNKSLILKIAEGYENFSIRFVDVNRHLADIPKSILYTHHHFAVPTYFRFFIPLIFKNYEKILYLDCDLVVKRDVAELYQLSVDGCLLRASRDIEASRLARHDEKFKDYLLNKLEIDEPSHYFNAGVSLFNIRQMVKENITEKLINKLSKIGTPCWVDQCVLNSTCHKQVKYFDLKWNVNWQIPLNCPDLVNSLRAADYYEFSAAYNSPYIVHFAGDIKPWKNPKFPLADNFWQYARQTPFYEIILQQNLPVTYQAPTQTGLDQQTQTNIRNYKYNSIKYKIYRVLAKIHPLRRKRAHYEKKRLAYKELLLSSKKALRRLDAQTQKNIRDYNYNSAKYRTYRILSKIHPGPKMRQHYQKKQAKYRELLQDARKAIEVR